MNLEVQETFRSLGTKARKAGSKKRLARATAAVPPEKLSRKDYERKLQKLQVELCYLQDWVRETGTRVIIICEGRDTAGKGGLIRRLTERVSPRTFRVVALSAPGEAERKKLFLQRYVEHFPTAGEVVIFDRSWYNRAGVERVMGYCSTETSDRFLDLTPEFERAMVESGIIRLKYWLEVSSDEQTRRLESRIHDARKIW